MPALTRFVGGLSLGFSMNAATRPSSSVNTSPYDDGSSTAISVSVALAPRRSWKSRSAERSRSVRMSPLRTAKRSSSNGSASLTAPAVPSGSGSST